MASCFAIASARRALLAICGLNASGRRSSSPRHRSFLALNPPRSSAASLRSAKLSVRPGARTKSLQRWLHGSPWHARQFSGFERFHRRFQISSAVSAKLIRFRDLALAARAGRVQVAFAVGTKVKARTDRCAALRTVVRQRLAHKEIDDEAQDEIAGHQHEHQERPKRGVHPATFGVLIDVAHHEDDDGAYQEPGGDNAHERRSSRSGIIVQFRSKDALMIRELEMENDLTDDLRNEEEHHRRPDEPARHELKLLPEAEFLFLPTKTNQAHPFVQRTLYALWIFGHRFPLRRARLVLLPVPIGLSAAPRVGHQQNKSDDCGRQRPPKTKAEFPDDVRHAKSVAGPFEPAPDVRRRRCSKRPGNPASCPDHAPARLAAKLLGAQADAELRAASQRRRQRNAQSTECTNGLLRRSGACHATRALRKMQP